MRILRNVLEQVKFLPAAFLKKAARYRMGHKKSILSAAAAAAAALLIAACAILFFPFRPGGPQSGISDVFVRRGSTPRQVAAALKAGSVIRNETLFLAAVKFMGVSRKLQAGRYHFEGRLCNFSVIRRIKNGITVHMTVTFPEGIQARRMAGILEGEIGSDAIRFMACVLDPETPRRLGIGASSIEGYLYPDTYRFMSSATPEEIIRKMVVHFNEVFADSLKARAVQTGFSVHQIVTLASIIEGEAVLDSERPIISALYHNRLRKGMALQADPTIQYLIPDGPRRLLKRDLAIDSPYNTYLYPGLPPGPVNNPSRASILAALYPAPVNYLYMVANGDGSHSFSTNIQDHISAKRRFNIIRNKIRHRSG
jgi:UPF0755 protein